MSQRVWGRAPRRSSRELGLGLLLQAVEGAAKGIVQFRRLDDPIIIMRPRRITHRRRSGRQFRRGAKVRVVVAHVDVWTAANSTFDSRIALGPIGGVKARTRISQIRNHGDRRAPLLPPVARTRQRPAESPQITPAAGRLANLPQRPAPSPAPHNRKSTWEAGSRRRRR